MVDAGRPSINIDAMTSGGSGIAVFGQWTGCDAVIGARCAVSATGDSTVRATFST
ncbi:MAG: hypothetical protein JF887_08440 [Candidatus Dormibacteraeota bacterium]|uniref:Uncharacterized protein n=1 Tax=Candidatus Amunia macphersoniae TaxID=3127014 RepID=A0A934NF45_9BACT|nr:hypothetical protein [Candidatus Dormibacteraeota bacterium]